MVQPEFGLALPEVDESAARLSWMEWAKKRGCSEREASACSVRIRGATLHVVATDAVQRRLHRLALEDEGWLLVGDGLVRRALCIQLESS
jgi:hypothetical protein